MRQISSLMAATYGPVAEFSRFANFEERKRKSNLLMSFSENGSPKGFFWPNKKKSVISLLSADSRYFRTYGLNKFQNNKTPGSDGLTIEFYRCFWEVLGHFMVDSFNYAHEYGHLSISQRLGIISLIPKKNKNLEHLSNWRPICLLNNDYKIATKVIAIRMEKVLPKIIHPSQTGYVKGRYIGESIRTISDIMSFTKTG